jgi:hypothetical protein
MTAVRGGSVSRGMPLLTSDLVRRFERLVAPEVTVPGSAPAIGQPFVTQFGRTIASKARGGRPSNKVFCFNDADIPHLDAILAYYAADDLEPTFYLSSVGFTRGVAAALDARGFFQSEFVQAMLYGVPSSELTSPRPGITIERVTTDNLDEYVATYATGFEWPDEWRDSAMEDTRRSFTPDQHRYLARLNGQAAAVATLRIRDGVASLGGGTTIPTCRGNGCHLALVRHRLDVAYMLGATLVIGGADFGSGSFRNQLRSGLRLAYIESGWTRRQSR